MNVTAQWDNEDQTVIRYDFELDWTWDEFHTAASDAYAMTLSVGHTVDTISNFKSGATLPANALFQFRRAMVNAPKNRGIWVIVGASAFVSRMVGMFNRFNRQFRERLLLADSLDEARGLLAQRRR